MKFTARILTGSPIHKKWSASTRTGGRIGDNLFRKTHGIYICDEVVDIEPLIMHPHVLVEAMGTQTLSPATFQFVTSGVKAAIKKYKKAD